MMEGYFVLFQVTLIFLHRNEDPRSPRFVKSCCADVRTFCLKCVFLHISHGFTNGLISFVLLFQVSVTRLRLAAGSEFLWVRHP
jgi:hypothetical protein